MSGRPLAVYLSDELISRLDRLAVAMSERAIVMRVTRSHAIRAAIERGAAALEGEFGISKKRGKSSG